MKTSANDGLRDQLEAKVQSFQGPAYRLNQLKADEAASDIKKITNDIFSNQWLDEAGLNNIISPEVIQVFIAKAMTVAQRAETLGIRITPLVSAGLGTSTLPQGGPKAGSSGPSNGLILPDEQAVPNSVTANPAGAQDQPTNAAQVPLQAQFLQGAFTAGPAGIDTIYGM